MNILLIFFFGIWAGYAACKHAYETGSKECPSPKAIDNTPPHLRANPPECFTIRDQNDIVKMYCSKSDTLF